eukprot:Anaeramoba_ignava/c20283_g1_i1.p1 GENE.c20283_g1_i1~~c20283_g1_i1.p1  ORF type:complete len:449 (-),score=81.82 c20283_g1_i1:278-1624(-)
MSQILEEDSSLIPTEPSQSPQFSNRYLLFLSAIGAAVGIGNTWRYPRIVAMVLSESGGEGTGVFLLIWISFLFLWSIPLIISEYSLGKYTRFTTPSTFDYFTFRKGRFMGMFISAAIVFITFYYAVISGWCLYYLFYFMFHSLPTNMDEAGEIFDGMQKGYPVLTLFAIILIVALACYHSVKSIEKANMILVPLLLLILFICFIKSLTFEYSSIGIRTFFYPDPKLLIKPTTWFNAIVQNSFDTGAAEGLFLTYANYMKEKHSPVKSGFFIPMVNNGISLLCGMLTFASSFGLLYGKETRDQVIAKMNNSGTCGTGLAFELFPLLFNSMGGVGRILCVFFFLALTCAVISSLISMFELPLKFLVDFKYSRKKALVFLSILVFVLGLPSALSTDFLSIEDYSWGNALLMSGLFLDILIQKNQNSVFHQNGHPAKNAKNFCISYQICYSC